MAYQESAENTLENFLGCYFEPINLLWRKEGSRHPIILNSEKRYIPYMDVNKGERKKMKYIEEIGYKRSIPELGLKYLDNTEL